MTVLLVAATGGHLAQLDRLATRIPGVGDDAVWVTFDSAQGRSLLADRRHLFVPYTGTRDLIGAVRNMRVAGRITRSVRPSVVISTGNSIAVPFLLVARAIGLPAVYIESATRAEGPSLTGRILRWIPGVRLCAQHREWARPPWHYVGSVFDEFVAGDLAPAGPIERVVVTLGTGRYGFRRLVDRLVKILPADCEVLWQVGETDVHDLDIVASPPMPSSELEAEMRRADVVIAHAGIGSALAAMDAGRCPVLVPRERAYGEHVDDHQRQIGIALDRLGLAVSRSAAQLVLEDLGAAARRSIVARADLPPIVIEGKALH